MTNRHLFKLPLDPERIGAVREHLAELEDRRETFERGLALGKMNAETAWLDETEPALCCLHEEHDDYSADVEAGKLDDQLQELSADHHAFFRTVAAPDHDRPEGLVEFERLFSVSARDRIGP
jgi:hypothetical protein